MVGSTSSTDVWKSFVRKTDGGTKCPSVQGKMSFSSILSLTRPILALLIPNEGSPGMLQLPATDPISNTTYSPISNRETLHYDNIIYLTREPKGRLRQPPDERKGAGAMVTYSDLFTFVIMLCAVITLVTNIKRKK